MNISWVSPMLEMAVSSAQLVAGDWAADEIGVEVLGNTSPDADTVLSCNMELVGVDWPISEGLNACAVLYVEPYGRAVYILLFVGL